jgi:DNA-binding XRE family transcriptional regulator
MSDREAKSGRSQPQTAREAALAYIADKRRQDPNWDYRTDPTYSGPFPAFIQMMSDAEFDRYMSEKVARQQLSTNPAASLATEPTEPQPTPRPRMPIRAALPFGERIRDLRRALGWTQREVAVQIGVSARSVIRYEQGRSAPLQFETLLALRRLEAHAQELDDSGRGSTWPQ